jgi:O-antigen ligase
VKILFYILFFFLPLVFFPFSSELFEFNKMVFVYLLTILISALWILKMILKKKIIFRRTMLDIPLLIFLCTQLLSTFVSIDSRTSLLGYYSRFNGGFASSLSYSFLYWAFVGNLDAKAAFTSARLLVGSTVLVSLYGVLEHFGIDKDLWVQDVQNRVFSSLGQPNWLAAWLVALLPIIWVPALKFPSKNKKFWLSFGLSVLFFITLLFTKSRSGIFGFIIADIIFWGCVLYNNKKEFGKKFFLFNLSFLILMLTIGTPWSRSIFLQSTTEPIDKSAPALETGGTESGEIRKIIWKGALEIWKHYPIVGTGPETFAYSYYNFRPVEHNLVSEWDFLYNKAHNEYLNYLANTGAIGLTAYLIFLGSVVYSFFKSLRLNPNFEVVALASGWASILVTNFFGFSVVPTQIVLFLFPGVAIALATRNTQETLSWKNTKTETWQKILVLGVFVFGLIMIFRLANYWYADFLYAKGKLLNNQGQVIAGKQIGSQAVSLSPRESIFWDEMAQSDMLIALALLEENEKDQAATFTQMAIAESETATNLSPRNLNLKRSQASMFIQLSEVDPLYLAKAKDVLITAITLAPTDAKLFYNLGLTQYRLGEKGEAVATLTKTIEMKKNYKEARLALAIILSQNQDREGAKRELNYILENIDPNDPTAKRELEELGK